MCHLTQIARLLHAFTTCSSSSLWPELFLPRRWRIELGSAAALCHRHSDRSTRSAPCDGVPDRAPLFHVEQLIGNSLNVQMMQSVHRAELGQALESEKLKRPWRSFFAMECTLDVEMKQA